MGLQHPDHQFESGCRLLRIHRNMGSFLLRNRFYDIRIKNHIYFTLCVEGQDLYYKSCPFFVRVKSENEKWEKFISIYDENSDRSKEKE